MSCSRLAACCRYESSLSGSSPARREGLRSNCSRVKYQRRPAAPPAPPPAEASMAICARARTHARTAGRTQRRPGARRAVAAARAYGCVTRGGNGERQGRSQCDACVFGTPAQEAVEAVEARGGGGGIHDLLWNPGLRHPGSGFPVASAPGPHLRALPGAPPHLPTGIPAPPHRDPGPPQPPGDPGHPPPPGTHTPGHSSYPK